MTNNVFRNCLTSRHKFGFAEAVISIYPSVRELHAQRTRYHRGIRIVGNTFETFDVPLLFAVSAEDVSFRGNRIVRNNDYRGWCAGDFLLGETAQVDIAPQLGSSGKTQKGIP